MYALKVYHNLFDLGNQQIPVYAKQIPARLFEGDWVLLENDVFATVKSIVYEAESDLTTINAVIHNEVGYEINQD